MKISARKFEKRPNERKMDKENQSIVTSTPKQDAGPSVLRENWRNITRKDENAAAAIGKKKKMNGKSENLFQSQKHRQNHFNQTKFDKQAKEREVAIQMAEKRRQTAIRAMQIAEQRRIRMSSSEDESKLADDLAKINLNDNLNNNQFLPDGRLRLTKKQLIARRMKQKRIEKIYADQEKKKKQKAKKGIEKEEPKKMVDYTFRPRPIYTCYAAGSKALRPILPKKIIACAEKENDKEAQPLLKKKTVKFLDDVFRPRPIYTCYAAKSSLAPCPLPKKTIALVDNIKDEMVTESKTDQVEAKTDCIVSHKYSKDQLREMNPFGFYFM
jgi:hypothetical protein